MTLLEVRPQGVDVPDLGVGLGPDWLDAWLAAGCRDLVDWRRTIHARPELARAEHETTALCVRVLTAAGLRARTAGNIGTPLVDVVRDVGADGTARHDVVAVELSSFQLHLIRSVSPYASVCLNLAPDHLDWHGGADAYRDAKARVYERTQVACVHNLADPVTERVVHARGVLREQVRGVPVDPAAALLERLRQVPVVERQPRLDAGTE